MQGYRTYLVALLGAVFGALSVLDWNLILNDPKVGWTLIVSAVAMAVLRAITSTPPAVGPGSGK